MKYIWHRGFHTKRKEENKMPALLKGLNDTNSLGIETDIRVTKDQVFVLYHDTLFKGKLINNTLYKEMKKEGIPKLSELLAIETEKILLLEIKDFNLNVNSLLKLLNKYNRNIYLMSFNNKIIEKIYQKNTHYKLGILNYVFNSEADYHYDFICLLNDLITPNMILSFQKLGIEIFSYGIRNKESMKYSNLTYIVNNEIIS